MDFSQKELALNPLNRQRAQLRLDEAEMLAWLEET